MQVVHVRGIAGEHASLKYHFCLDRDIALRQEVQGLSVRACEDEIWPPILSSLSIQDTQPETLRQMKADMKGGPWLIFLTTSQNKLGLVIFLIAMIKYQTKSTQGGKQFIFVLACGMRIQDARILHVTMMGR